LRFAFESREDVPGVFWQLTLGERDMSYVRLALLVCACLAPHAASAAVMLDFETDARGNPLAAGTIVRGQYKRWDIHIDAGNATPGHPDRAIIFDTSNPTGNDFDLATPGYHPTNTTSYGNVLILAENRRDYNRDGIIDDPDDEEHNPAGWISFRADRPQNVASFTFLDIEETDGSIDFFLYGIWVNSIPIPALDDNAITTAAADGFEFNSVRINFAGSGALVDLMFDFDDGDGATDPVPDPEPEPDPQTPPTRPIVPEPTTIILLGLGALGFARKRVLE
jgi:hypothetical protein